MAQLLEERAENLLHVLGEEDLLEDKAQNLLSLIENQESSPKTAQTHPHTDQSGVESANQITSLLFALIGIPLAALLAYREHSSSPPKPVNLSAISVSPNLLETKSYTIPSTVMSPPVSIPKKDALQYSDVGKYLKTNVLEAASYQPPLQSAEFANAQVLQQVKMPQYYAEIPKYPPLIREPILYTPKSIPQTIPLPKTYTYNLALPSFSTSSVPLPSIPATTKPK